MQTEQEEIFSFLQVIGADLDVLCNNNLREMACHKNNNLHKNLNSCRQNKGGSSKFLCRVNFLFVVNGGGMLIVDWLFVVFRY